MAHEGCGMIVHLQQWSLWRPGIASPEAYGQWLAAGAPPLPPEDAPDVSFLPALFRRRLSRLSKMALWVARDCLGESDPTACRTVFGSRHGEMPRTLRLLEQMAQGESLSPTDFAMSVHNTAAGLFSIWAGNQQPATAIAAGPASLAASLLEAFGQAARHPQQAVLLVFADEALPGVFTSYADEPMITGALALRLMGGGPGEPLHWHWAAGASAAPGTAPDSSPAGEPQPWRVARWLLAPAAPLALPLPGGTLMVTRQEAAPA